MTQTFSSFRFMSLEFADFVPVSVVRVDSFTSTVTFLPARRYASAGLCDSDVSGRPSVRHTPVLCLAERKQDREMYTV